MTIAQFTDRRIYHIVHVDRLPSIITDRRLWCDEEVSRRSATNPGMGSAIGMDKIKQRRLNELALKSHPSLYIGQCVPFYFCPKSVMLYLIHRKDPELRFRGGQEPIVHLEADLHRSAAWADENRHWWAFTLSNAGSRNFKDRNDLARLGELDWVAIDSRDPRDQVAGKHGRQAEFLMERYFPWSLVERIGVISREVKDQVDGALRKARHRPRVEVRRDWYH